MFWIIITVLFNLHPSVNTVILDRCVLVRILDKHNVSYSDVGNWVCLALRSANMDTAKRYQYPDSGVTTYGIFQILNTYWCRDDYGENDSCHIPCANLIDDDIKDDLKCALKIHAEHGFEGWIGSKNKCSGNNMEQYTAGCRDEKPVEFLNTKKERKKKFIKGVENQYLLCTAKGYPPPMLKWVYNATEFEGAYTREEVTEDPEEVKLKLIFPETWKKGEKVFMCIAENSLTTEYSSFKIKMLDIPRFPFEIVIPVTLAIMVVILMLSLLFFRIRKYLVKGGLSKAEIEDFEQGFPEKMELNGFAHENIHYQPYDKSFEINAGKLIIYTNNVIGSGQFGMVMKGEYDGNPVAVKTVQAHAETLYIKALLSELKIMMYIGRHPGIVSLIGAQTRELHRGKIYIAVEFCFLGDLEKYLRTNKLGFIDLYSEINEASQKLYANIDGISSMDLLVWASQIASAMEYLENKKVIHGDLACRNVLLCDKTMVKVTDFGLSRQLYAYTNYVKKQQAPLPWRWLAIESLTTLTFSSQSDVWSFGVTLWEMFSLGDIPYPGLSWSLEFPALLENGTRLLKPKYASNPIYKLMLNCWEADPEARPNFKLLYEWLVHTKEQLVNSKSVAQ